MQIEKIIRDGSFNTKVIVKALNNYGDIFVVDNLMQAVRAVNEMAPEHVELQGKKAEAFVDEVVNAGAVFVGEYSTEPVGDYFCGSNHILPTCGTARFSSGLSVNDFMRGYSIINYTKEALNKNADYIMKLAKIEGLDAHSYAVEVRRN
jgi:histidinol dehydrogenase